jgi:hypothetical protein
MNHPFVELVGSSGTRTWAANQQALAHALAEEFSGMSPADPSQVPVAGVFDMNRMAANLITRLGLPAE